MHPSLQEFSRGGNSQTRVPYPAPHEAERDQEESVAHQRARNRVVQSRPLGKVSREDKATEGRTTKNMFPGLASIIDRSCVLDDFHGRSEGRVLSNSELPASLSRPRPVISLDVLRSRRSWARDTVSGAEPNGDELQDMTNGMEAEANETTDFTEFLSVMTRKRFHQRCRVRTQ